MTRALPAHRSAVLPIVLTLAALAPGPAWADVRPGSRVLVIPFAASVDAGGPGNAGTAFWLGEAAAILLTEQLPQLGGGAVSRAERVAAFDRVQLPMSPRLTLATLIRVGELVGASDIVYGEVRLGPTLSVRARLVSLSTGRAQPEVLEEGAVADIVSLVGRVARRLGAALGHSGPAGPAPIVFPTFEAFENYVKGLVAATPAAQQRLLEAARKQAPRDGRVLTALWSVYTAQGAHEKALAAASDVPADSPWSRKGRFAAALSLIELRRFDGAFKALGTLQSERPSPVLVNAIGVVQLRRGLSGGTGGAASYFKRAVDLEPGNVDFLFNLGYAYAVAREESAALEWLREAVRHDAASGDAHLVMSAVLASAGKLVESGREAELAHLLGARAASAPRTPADQVPSGLERLPAELESTAARVEASIAQPAQRDQEETAASYLDQGRRLFTAQSDREAIAALRRAIYLSPYADEPHLLLGRLYQRGGRLQEAIDELRIAIWCRESADARVALGAALLQSGDRDAARREVERALVLAPDSADAKALLQRIGGAARVLLSRQAE